MGGACTAKLYFQISPRFSYSRNETYILSLIRERKMGERWRRRSLRKCWEKRGFVKNRKKRKGEAERRGKTATKRICKGGKEDVRLKQKL